MCLQFLLFRRNACWKFECTSQLQTHQMAKVFFSIVHSGTPLFRFRAVCLSASRWLCGVVPNRSQVGARPWEPMQTQQMASIAKHHFLTLCSLIKSRRQPFRAHLSSPHMSNIDWHVSHGVPNRAINEICPIASEHIWSHFNFDFLLIFSMKIPCIINYSFCDF